MPREPWTHREEAVGGLRLHWVEAGEGPLVLLPFGLGVELADLRQLLQHLNHPAPAPTTYLRIDVSEELLLDVTHNN